MRIVFVLALGLLGCKDSEPEWLSQMRPRLQAILDGQGKKLAPVLPLVQSGAPIACSGASAGKIPSLSRELAARLAAGATKALSQKPRKTPSNVLDGDAYRALLGDTFTYAPSTFEPAIKELASARQVGIFVTHKLDPGHAKGRSIEKQGHFEGELVLVDLTAPKLLARVPVSADTSPMVMISNDYGADVQLLEDLESNVRTQAAKALQPGCPGVTFYRCHCVPVCSASIWRDFARSLAAATAMPPSACAPR